MSLTMDQTVANARSSVATAPQVWPSGALDSSPKPKLRMVSDWLHRSEVPPTRTLVRAWSKSADPEVTLLSTVTLYTSRTIGYAVLSALLTSGGIGVVGA